MIYETVKQWERFREDFLESLSHGHGTHNEDDVLGRILTGEYKFWVFENSAVVTFFVQYPQMKALNLFISAGSMEELRAMQPMMEMWAKTQGVTRFVGGGRPGWERVARDYTKNGCMFYKDI